MKRGMVTISKLLNGERNKVLNEVETIIECELTESVYRELSNAIVERNWILLFDDTEPLEKPLSKMTKSERQCYQDKFDESIKERKKEYYKKNKDCISERKKEYYKKNKDKFKEYRKKNKDKFKEYRKKNKDKIKEYNKEYHKRHKEVKG